MFIINNKIKQITRLEFVLEAIASLNKSLNFVKNEHGQSLLTTRGPYVDKHYSQKSKYCMNN